MKLSIVVPCYNEQDNILPFYRECLDAFSNKAYRYEIIFVNDGSTDQTWERLLSLSESADNVSLIDLSRNFGKDAAMYAGMRRASGEYTAVIDADLQQRPAYIADMVEFLEQNRDYDEVAMYQERRSEGRLVEWLKGGFYRLARPLLGMDFKPGASDFRTFRRRVAEAILSLPEHQRFSKGVFSWVGFKTHYMPYTAEKRLHGRSSWPVKKLFSYAFGGFVSFSTLPLRIAAIIGALCALASLLYILVVIYEHIFMNIQPSGYATTVFLILFIGGIQMIMLGIIGEYIAHIFIESKNRPLYIEREYLPRREQDAEDRS